MATGFQPTRRLLRHRRHRVLRRIDSGEEHVMGQLFGRDDSEPEIEESDAEEGGLKPPKSKPPKVKPTPLPIEEAPVLIQTTSSSSSPTATTFPPTSPTTTTFLPTSPTTTTFPLTSPTTTTFPPLSPTTATSPLTLPGTTVGGPGTTVAVTTSAYTTTSAVGQPILVPTTLVTSSTSTSTGKTTSATRIAETTTSADAAVGNRNGIVSGGSRLKPGTQAGIAIGTIAAVAMLASIIFFLWRRYKRKRGDINGSSSVENLQPSTRAPPDPRTDSQILDDLMTEAYAVQNGGTVPTGYVVSPDEKQPDGTYPVTMLDVAPIPQAEIRSSIASWLRRHHPLKLNPMAGRSSMFPGSKRGSVASSMPRSPVSPLAPPPLRPQAPQNSGASLAPPPQRFQSMWSDTSRGTDLSEGNMSILSFYGQPQVPHTGLSPRPEATSPGQNRADSPVFGVAQ